MSNLRVVCLGPSWPVEFIIKEDVVINSEPLKVRTLNMGPVIPEVKVVELPGVLGETCDSREDFLHRVFRAARILCIGDVIDLKEGQFLIVSAKRGIGFKWLLPAEYDKYLNMRPLDRCDWAFEQAPNKVNGWMGK